MDVGGLSLTLCEDTVEEEEENIITGNTSARRGHIGSATVTQPALISSAFIQALMLTNCSSTPLQKPMSKPPAWAWPKAMAWASCQASHNL